MKKKTMMDFIVKPKEVTSMLSQIVTAWWKE
jgi:hypothetical protein